MRFLLSSALLAVGCLAQPAPEPTTTEPTTGGSGPGGPGGPSCNQSFCNDVSDCFAVCPTATSASCTDGVCVY